MKSVACYIRVSTVEQADEGYSIVAQKERLTAYCKARDWLIYEYYIDGGFSGSNIVRPAMQKLVADIKANKIDAVLVYKLDRLSRSQKDTLLLIEDVFNKHDVSFVSINENFDTSSSFGRAMIGILSVFAQLEREQIKERTLMGRIERAKDGYFHGGGFSPIGYTYADGELTVDPYEAMQVREAFELFLKGKSISGITKILASKYKNQYGSWGSTSAVVSLFTTPIYKGVISYRGEEYEGRHESIVSVETYDKATSRYDLIRWNKFDDITKKNPFNTRYVLSGITTCGNCGARYYAKGNYSGHGDKKTYHPYYTCHSRGKSNPKMIKDPTCKNKSYYVLDLEKMVYDEIKKLSFNPSLVKQIKDRKDTEPDISNLVIIESRIKDLDGQISRLLDLYQLNSVPINNLSDRIDAINQEKKKLIDQIENTVTPIPKLDTKKVKKLLNRVDNVLDGSDFETKKNIVHSLIENITINGNDIVINWTF